MLANATFTLEMAEDEEEPAPPAEQPDADDDDLWIGELDESDEPFEREDEEEKPAPVAAQPANGDSNGDWLDELLPEMDAIFGD
jgi:hypothetical protein